MKLKTTIYGKSSTLIGTPDEISALLEAVRRTARQRAIDSLPRIVSAGERLASKPAPNKTWHVKNVFKPAFEPIAQTREEIINEAIADVEDLLGREYTSGHTPEVVEHVGTVISFNLDDRIDFFVNKKKRVVAAKVWIDSSIGTAADKSYATTGIARCAPSDVFNEHVGKAIALRRALGLEVPAKYYEVGGIAPEGKQVGDVVYGDSTIDPVCRLTAGGMDWVNGMPDHKTAGVNSAFAETAKVIDDSARYVAPSTPAAKVVYVGE